MGRSLSAKRAQAQVIDFLACAAMADEPPPMDYGEGDEDGEVEQSRPEASEEKGTEEPPASLEPDEEDEPPSLEPESEPTQPDPLSPPPAGQAVSAPPPTLEARAADDGDEVPVTKPVVQQLQRTLDLFDDEPPAYPQHVSSQVRQPSALFVQRYSLGSSVHTVVV